MLVRFWQYQKERFPLAMYALLVAALTFAASATGTLTTAAFLLVFCQAFIAFALLRIVDEFKDYDDDKTFRSYRPVPRGLVSLKELAVLGFALTLIQWACAFYLNNHWFLLAWWFYFGLMSKEFFISTILKAHPVSYLFSHMAIMVVFSALLANGFQPMTKPVYGFALLAFLTGLLLEVGRKIRLFDEEENGVETYSLLWGRNKALIIWTLICVASTALMFTQQVIAGFCFIGLLSACSVVFLRPLKAKIIETLSAVWLLTLFIAWGLVA